MNHAPIFRVGRRHFLRGAGGYTLGLPLLPSLLTKAYGADPLLRGTRRLVTIRSEHGAIIQTNMFPPLDALTERMELYPGHEIASGKLQRTVMGADAQLSPVLRTPASELTDRIVSKMNVTRGIDATFYAAHQHGVDFGNFAASFGGPANGLAGHATPTIDQWLAWSPNFYKDLTGVKQRAVMAGDWISCSWNYSNPAARTGSIQQVSHDSSPSSLFKKVFAGVTAPTMDGAAARKPVVDKVLQSYKVLRDGSRRLSAGDRQRLDDHMDRLAELQRRLTVTVRPSCGMLTAPSGTPGNTERDPAAAMRKWRLMNDVIAAAFMCGASRVAVERVRETFSTFSGSWHQDIAHQWPKPGPRQSLVDGLRLHLQATLLDLARKLDVEETPGSTCLDNTLIMWSQESGQSTHDPVCIPFITAGGAGGALKTGRYISFESRAKLAVLPHSTQAGTIYHGVTLNQWLGTVAQAMGIPRAEYEKTNPGYGYLYVSSDYRKRYVPQVLARTGDMLPLVT